MSISPRDPQNRLPLTLPLSAHDQRSAGTLVNLQIHPTTITAAAVIGQDMPVDIDVVRGSTTTAAAAVYVTLPPGSPEIVGHIYEALKVDSDAHIFGFARAGTDTFEDASTSFGTAVQNGSSKTYWDGTVWRKVSGATGGALPPATSGTIGDGTGSPSLTLNKSGTGTDKIILQSASVQRGLLQLDASEDLILAIYDTDGTTLLGSLTFNHTTGAITSAKGVTITSGGLIITAGGQTISAGNLILTAGVRLQANVPAAADDAAAAALSPAVPVGGFYHVSGAVKQRLA